MNRFCLFKNLIKILILIPSMAYATSVNVVNLDVSEGVKGGFFSPDYSIDVNALVINKGRSGEATLNITLRCGKNSWKHKQSIKIDKNETQTVSLIFTEPTVDDGANGCVAEYTVDDSWF